MAEKVTAADLVSGAYNGRLVREAPMGDIGMTVSILRGAELHMGRVRVTLARLGYVFDDLQSATPGKDYSQRDALENVFYVMGATAEPHQLSDARDATGCYCPGDCGCKRGRNVCGCTGKHGA